MLMDDVSQASHRAAASTRRAFRLLLDGLARLHGRYWERTAELGRAADPDARPAHGDVHRSVRCGRRAGRADRLGGGGARQGLPVPHLRACPARRLGSADGDFYLDLCEHRDRWLAPLSRLPQTLIHGDLRRANIAVLPSGGMSLFDWDFACRAPAAADLAWYWFLHFWCYPPNDGRAPEDREPLKAYYVQRLDEALGGRLDRRRSSAPGTSPGSRCSRRSASAWPTRWSARLRRTTLRACGRSAPRRSTRRGGSPTPMPDEEPITRRQDDWTYLDAPDAAVAAIAKLEALGQSAAEIAARDAISICSIFTRGRPCSTLAPAPGAALEMAHRVRGNGRVVALDPSARTRRIHTRGRRRVRRRRHPGVAPGPRRDAAVSGRRVRPQLQSLGPAARRRRGGCDP